MYQKFINGDWISTGDTTEVIDPATGQQVDKVVLGTVEDVNRAVEAAQQAVRIRKWREHGVLRAEFLWCWADRIKQDRHRLATLLTRENGKVMAEAEREILATVDTLKFAAGQARQLEGRSLTLGSGMYGEVIPEPLGVVGFIIPWNWPVLLLVRELAPALAAGNSAIIKPALLAPLTVLEIFRDLPDTVVVPRGLIHVIPGEGVPIGEAIVSHRHVAAVSFTGSTQTGQRIGELAARGIKKVLLELGGKSSSIIFPDAPLERMIPVLVQGMYGSSGQNCMAASRILVHDAIYNAVRDKLVETIASLRVGPGLAADTTMGPLITEHQVAVSQEAVNAGVRDGGRVLIGGQRMTGGVLKDGFFFAPTLIENVPCTSSMVQHEIFGPVVSLERFQDEDAAITFANSTAYGLVSSVWTRDHDRAVRVARQLETGTVWINTYQKTFAEAESGGMKSSGLGRSRGKAGLYEYTELKNVVSEVL